MEKEIVAEQLFATKSTEPNLVSPKILAKMYKIGINTIYRLTHIKGFPVITIGRKRFIPKDAFDDWIKNNLGKCI